MRYVIAFVSLAFFLMWDGIYNEGRYIAQGVRTVRYAFHMIGL